MAILIRLDIDKPFGRANLVEKVKSKIREDYWLPAFPASSYLQDLADLLEYVNSKNVPVVSYHRLCTRPSVRIQRLLKKGNHAFGLHAENTRSLESLRSEVETLRQHHSDFPLHSFTKHGSGELKLGRHHYAPYEPEKYLQWAKELGVPFPSGNGVAQSKTDFEGEKNYYPNVFWLEPSYRSEAFNNLEEALAVARDNLVVFSTHPENLKAIPEVKKAFLQIIDEGKAQKIPFVTAFN